MSDQPNGPDWWRASDGKWYPPTAQPGTSHSTTPTRSIPPLPGGLRTTTTETYTTEELLIALGAQVVTIPKLLQAFAVLAALQLVLMGLWLLGVITMDVRPA
jgi:hypothetical protein